MHRYSVLVAAIVLAACIREDPAGAPRVRDQSSPTLPEKALPDQPAQAARAQLAPTQGSTVTGALALNDSPQGVRVTGAIQQLPPNGEFGFHIHEKGDCSAPDASSAGEHFNPGGRAHGDPTKANRHAGDIVNLRSDAAGVAQVDTTVKDVSLQAGNGNDVLNKAIVVHARPDDYGTQPSGNSEERLACGVIAPTSPSEIPSTP